MIFKYAFFPNAILGGGLGYALKTAISQGAKRGAVLQRGRYGLHPPCPRHGQGTRTCWSA